MQTAPDPARLIRAALARLGTIDSQDVARLGEEELTDFEDAKAILRKAIRALEEREAAA